MRFGIGYDIHRLIGSLESSSVWIGGLAIPCNYRTESHSDGDVLLHSLTDALLGALALGDIGQWFPNTLEENRNRASSEFVRIVYTEVERLGWELVNFDSIVILEEPKLAEHMDGIRRNLAKMLKVELSAISVKAKSAEGLGAIGHRKAIAAHASVALQERRR